MILHMGIAFSRQKLSTNWKIDSPFASLKSGLANYILRTIFSSRIKRTFARSSTSLPGKVDSSI